MPGLLDLAMDNLLSPMVLCFVLGAVAAALRSELAIPEAMAKGLAIYLMLAIGIKGGVAMAEAGGLAAALSVLLAGTISLLMPIIGYGLLRGLARTPVADAAAIAAHYGSVSVVTFVTAAQFMADSRESYEGYLVAMLAVMETPAIITGLLLARLGGVSRRQNRSGGSALWREVLLNGSVVLLVGGFLVGWIVGKPGLAKIDTLFIDVFNGALCLFLLDMGLVAMRQLRSIRELRAPLIAFAFVMPLIGAAIGMIGGLLLGLSVGGMALFATLTASASYIAVPAAMRLALPEARPSIYITLSLGLTFPFNITIGIPLYYAVARSLGS